MGRLDGKRIALTGPRKAEELSLIVEKLGGIPLIRPAQGTVFLEDETVEANIRQLLQEPIDWFILTTGIGTETLYNIAQKIGLEAQFMAKLKQAKIAGRGYKTVGVLKKLGLEPTARDDDGTTAGLLRALAPFDLNGCHVALQLHGDPAPKLVAWLEQQGALYKEILPYRHVPPAPELLSSLISEIIRGDIDAVTFTSGPQVRFILEHARANGSILPLIAAFEHNTVAVAVGKYTSECLREEGILRVVAPEQERMGSMILSLAQFYEATS